MRKLMCFLFNHRLKIVWTSDCKRIQKLYCIRCKRFFGIHYGVEVFIPWDVELEEIRNIISPKGGIMIKESCKTCKFYYEDGVCGECRRFPPEVCHTTINEKPIFHDTIYLTPIVKYDFWCGEWKQKTQEK